VRVLLKTGEQLPDRSFKTGGDAPAAAGGDAAPAS
jgi:hypothetical protein